MPVCGKATRRGEFNELRRCHPFRGVNFAPVGKAFAEALVGTRAVKLRPEPGRE